MNYNWKCKKYECNYTALTNTCLTLNMDSVASDISPLIPEMRRALPKICGPAIKHERDVRRPGGYFPTKDFVKTIGCPMWPKKAQGWLKRPRNNKWPTIDTISEVVQNGCHVVYVQHRSCRDDEKQWRLSFSVAEIILLQSCTQIQQLVYH